MRAAGVALHGQRSVAPSHHRIRIERSVHLPSVAAMGGGGPQQRAPPRIVTLDPFPSSLAPRRRVDVLLPPSLSQDAASAAAAAAAACAAAGYAGAAAPPPRPARRYPVLIMHDGQNVLDDASSFTGVSWGLAEAASELWASGQAQEFVAACVWNTPGRQQEYMPAAPLTWLAAREGCWYERVEEKHLNPTSDAYVDMLARELLPWLVSYCSADSAPRSAAVAGSSMGGLVSLYALTRHPQTFGAAACLSTHWPPGDGVTVGWLAAGNMPDPKTHRLYFDHGTETLDAQYPPYQQAVDAVAADAGYVQGVNYMSRVFRGAEHNEAAWRARLREPLRFMFGRRSTFGGASPRSPGLGVVRAYERSPRAAAFSPSGVWRS